MYILYIIVLKIKLITNLHALSVAILKTPPEELHIELEGKKLTQDDSFVYLGRALCGDEKTEKDVGLGLRRRAQAGANTWRAVEGVMADRRISKRLKGKVTSTCVM